MDKRRAALKQRKYVINIEAHGIATVCDQWPDVKVGSASCESDCGYFHSADHDNKTINCYDPDKELY